MTIKESWSLRLPPQTFLGLHCFFTNIEYALNNIQLPGGKTLDFCLHCNFCYICVYFELDENANKL